MKNIDLQCTYTKNSSKFSRTIDISHSLSSSHNIEHTYFQFIALDTKFAYFHFSSDSFTVENEKVTKMSINHIPKYLWNNNITCIKPHLLCYYMLNSTLCSSYHSNEISFCVVVPSHLFYFFFYFSFRAN